jgi:multisubunit Na+/H+ antiporter MnhB subunit
MKYVNMFLALLMLLFIGVQYNDPDGLFWAVLYGGPAILAGWVAFDKDFSRKPILKPLYSAGLIIMVFLTYIYWPQTEGFWHKEVWWNTETAREGMGLMIATVVALVATVTVWSSKTTNPIKA